MTGGASKRLSSERMHELLLATVHEFIATAQPVGSRQLVSRGRIGVKAAMVRNLMSELEAEGYLVQPHTSAGRLPTVRGFRYYVDNVMPVSRIGFDDRAQIELHYSDRERDLDEIMRDTPRLLALLTGQAALVMTPRLESVRLERVNFIRVRPRQVAVVCVARAGGVQSRLVETDRDHGQAELDRMTRYLNQSLEGRTLEEVRRWIEGSLKEERAARDRFRREALMLGGAIAEYLSGSRIYVGGSVRAIEQPEFADRAMAREFLGALEDRTALLDLLEKSLEQQGPMVSIGSENFDHRLAGLSVIAASYLSGSVPLGSLAVVGPVRMDYERVIPLVDYTAKALSRLLEQ